MVSCVGKYSNKSEPEGRINGEDSINLLTDLVTQDSIKIDEIIFGRFCGECGGNCAPMFRLNTEGNANTLWADYDNNYFKGTDSLKFETDLNKSEKLNIAYDVMWKLPRVLREMKTDFKRFGCPDCTDGCGIYLEIRSFSENNIRKRFALDLYPQDKDSIPEEVSAYAQYISLKVNELEK